VRPDPASSQRGRAVGEPVSSWSLHGVKGHLRVAGADLHADVAAADARQQRVAVETSAGSPAGRRCRSSPNRSLPLLRNSDGPNPNVTVSSAAGSPMASPVSTGVAAGPHRADPLPARHPAAASDQTRSSARRSAIERVSTSNAANCRVLGGRGDPGLMRA